MTSRQRVLNHLGKNRPASAREIARALNMSAPTVRHHLGVLAADGLVEMMEIRPRGGRGRPEKLYSLSQTALGDNLPALTNALLGAAGSRLNLEAVAGRILDSSQFSNLPSPKRLSLLIEKLNEMHYQARWEAGAEGPRVIFGRCPYARVIDGHPVLCKMDAVILKMTLAQSVTQTLRNEAPARGACPFVFQVK
ncbi:MAG: winged helix-turn-helix transcriptional regulator [Anaerolineaceae bacterium]|jgi:predicted ArsR family transcriptional regulator|nr:MAG: winged helix-turn-helix transcriptional regulator [Anaerolineaceae bacterium]